MRTPSYTQIDESNKIYGQINNKERFSRIREKTMFHKLEMVRSTNIEKSTPRFQKLHKRFQLKKTLKYQKFFIVTAELIWSSTVGNETDCMRLNFLFNYTS